MLNESQDKHSKFQQFVEKIKEMIFIIMVKLLKLKTIGKAILYYR